MSDAPHSPAVAERPDEYAELRQLVANQRAHDEALVKYPMTAPIIHNVKFKTAHADALASLLRAYEGMRADAERWRWFKRASYDGTLLVELKAGVATRIRADDIDQFRAARASAPDRAPGDANG